MNSAKKEDSENDYISSDSVDEVSNGRNEEIFYDCEEIG